LQHFSVVAAPESIIAEPQYFDAALGKLFMRIRLRRLRILPYHVPSQLFLSKKLNIKFKGGAVEAGAAFYSVTGYHNDADPCSSGSTTLPDSIYC
jgi:hypothetical protein